MSRKWLAVLMALCLTLLTACAPLTLSTEELLVAPRLNQRQEEVYRALGATMDVNRILYKYPQHGDYRAPFVFYDLDGDGVQEAIVFYSFQDDPDTVWVKVLEEDGQDNWSARFDHSYNGDQIDFVQFANILSDDWQCMVIGWQNSVRGTAALGVYSFNDGVFRVEVEPLYHAYLIDDFNQNGLSEIALVSLDGDTDTYRLHLLGSTSAGRLASMGDIPLSVDVNSVLQMSAGRLWNGRRAVYIDERRTDTYVATEVVAVSADTLDMVVGENREYENYRETFRSTELLCAELTGNGVVYIPRVAPLPGTDSGEEIAPPPLIEYMELAGEDRFDIAHRVVRNEEAGYMVFFPEAWAEQVTVVLRPDSNEWRFYRIDINYGSVSTELLRIKAYTIRDYRDAFDDYFLLAEKGIHQYYGYIPRTTGEPLAVTQEQVLDMFALI